MNNIPWYAGVPSRSGPTRKAFHYQYGDDEFIDQFMDLALNKVKLRTDNISILGVYFNYYKDGNDWTPNHKHPTKQIVISLGSQRTLMIGKKAYAMNNGDIIEFGRSLHGVPKEPGAEPRISIAFFAVQ